ncbi:MAG: SOUL family heme-binding protein [Gammaproteobacteria bacterium]
MKLFMYSNKSFLLIGVILLSSIVMSYEEPKYKVINQSENYEIRFYDERLVAQTLNGSSNNSFRKLFKFISGSNKKSQKISMTVPVTQFKSEENNTMQFYLPSIFNMTNIPIPDDSDVEIARISSGYFAVIKFSGRASDKNFRKHSNQLRKNLEKNEISILGPAIKATYNGPITLPMFRRNESMFQISWK